MNDTVYSFSGSNMYGEFCYSIINMECSSIVIDTLFHFSSTSGISDCMLFCYCSFCEALRRVFIALSTNVC